MFFEADAANADGQPRSRSPYPTDVPLSRSVRYHRAVAGLAESLAIVGISVLNVEHLQTENLTLAASVSEGGTG